MACWIGFVYNCDMPPFCDERFFFGRDRRWFGVAEGFPLLFAAVVSVWGWEARMSFAQT